MSALAMEPGGEHLHPLLALSRSPIYLFLSHSVPLNCETRNGYARHLIQVSLVRGDQVGASSFHPFPAPEHDSWMSSQVSVAKITDRSRRHSRTMGMTQSGSSCVPGGYTFLAHTSTAMGKASGNNDQRHERESKRPPTDWRKNQPPPNHNQITTFLSGSGWRPVVQLWV